MNGLLVDFGGVLTTNVFASFRAFCTDEGIDPNPIKALFRSNAAALAAVRALEKGELSEDEFADRFGELLEVEALRRARAQGVMTGLVSNSMGAGRYDRASFPELFDGVVISGDVGMHKPQPEIFLLGADRVGVAPEQ
jgi:putative hydrolase of the HAD superfamily